MILDFFKTVSTLKEVPRQGWIDKLNLKNPESVADHSYMTSLMSLVLSEEHKLDTLKIVKMSLLHDIAETKIGDFMPEDLSRDRKILLENNAMIEILSDLPESLNLDYQNIWNEFIQAQSDEAIFVHEIDKLEMALQAKIYSQENSEKNVTAFFDSARLSIRNKELQKILDEIISK